MCYLNSVIDFKSLLLSIWDLFKAIFALGPWHLPSSGYSSPKELCEDDLEEGIINEKADSRRAFPFSLASILRQPFFENQLTSNDVKSGLPPTTYTVSNFSSEMENSESFVDLVAVKMQHRHKLISRGQRYVSPPSVFVKPKSHLTGDQLSNSLHPPEPRGEDFRKWILVMETLFPNRATHLSNYKALRNARHAMRQKKTAPRPPPVFSNSHSFRVPQIKIRPRPLSASASVGTLSIVTVPALSPSSSVSSVSSSVSLSSIASSQEQCSPLSRLWLPPPSLSCMKEGTTASTFSRERRSSSGRDSRPLCFQPHVNYIPARRNATSVIVRF